MNNAFRGAYRKGRLAFREKGAAARCPYPDHRGGKHQHVITFSRAFQNYWHRGVDDEREGLPFRYSIEKRGEE